MLLSNSEYYEMMMCVGAEDSNLRVARELYRRRFIEGRLFLPDCGQKECNVFVGVH